MHESTTAERSKVRQLLDDAASCRVDDPVHARELALAARTIARASAIVDDEAEALYSLASIAHQRGRTGDAFALAKSSGGTKDGSRTRAVLAVGPEGGWTEYERRSMSERGFTEVALGNRTFATDVACLALVAAVRERTGSW